MRITNVVAIKKCPFEICNAKVDKDSIRASSVFEEKYSYHRVSYHRIVSFLSYSNNFSVVLVAAAGARADAESTTICVAPASRSRV